MQAMALTDGLQQNHFQWGFVSTKGASLSQVFPLSILLQCSISLPNNLCTSVKLFFRTVGKNLNLQQPHPRSNIPKTSVVKLQSADDACNRACTDAELQTLIAPKHATEDASLCSTSAPLRPTYTCHTTLLSDNKCLWQHSKRIWTTFYISAASSQWM